MVFGFRFVTADDLVPEDEGVPLDGSPPNPDSTEPQLYVHHNAFLKVLGATVDVNTQTVQPVLYDREGNHMDPNA